MLLCWLDLLLIRLAETETGQPRERLRDHLEQMHCVKARTVDGTFEVVIEPNPTQRNLPSALDIEAPKKVQDVIPRTQAALTPTGFRLIAQTPWSAYILSDFMCLQLSNPGWENSRRTYYEVVRNAIQEMVESNFQFYTRGADDETFLKQLFNWLCERFRERMQKECEAS